MQQEPLTTTRLGDCYSKQESLIILEKISEDYHEPILALKAGVEHLYLGGMKQLSQRSRSALARRMGVKGYVVLADNVGRVSQITFSVSFTS